jgi:hypothetical protein
MGGEAMSVISLSKLTAAQLTPAARLKRYRALPAHARHEAEAKSDAWHSFLVIAQQGEELAADMESHSENGAAPNRPTVTPVRPAGLRPATAAGVTKRLREIEDVVKVIE